MSIFIKDKKHFLDNYEKFAQMVFWKDSGEDKVEIKIAVPAFAKEVKNSLKMIKN